MKAFTIFVLGLALRAALILADPIIFGGDTIIRLADRYTLVKSHQLPALQALIAAVSWISLDPALVRYLMTVIGAVAGVAFYWLVEDLFGEKWAFPAALLFVTNPFILAVSTVPFQEILMLGALFLAFHYFYREQWLISSLSLAAACLTRYEAWAACPVLAAAYILQNYRSARRWITAAALFGWMPIVWIIAHRGLTSTGHFVIETSISIWRLQRYVYLGWITAKYTQITVLVLAAAGVWRLWKRRSPLDRKLTIQIAFVALFLISVPFSAHGVMPDPERYVTSREAHIPIYFVLLLAAIGFEQWPRWNRSIVVASTILGIAGAWWYVRTETSLPVVQVVWRTARYLDSHVGRGESVLVLAPPVDEGTSRLYLDKARETGGERGFEEARRELREANAYPPDYQRLTVDSRLPRSRLLTPPAVCADWAAVWNGYPGAAREVANGRQMAVIRSGNLSVTILRRHCD